MHANGSTPCAGGGLPQLSSATTTEGRAPGGGREVRPVEGRYDLKKVPDAHAGWGIPITRQKVEYEKTSYFKQAGYPAPRPWYRLPGNLSHEIVPTLRAGYVYDHLGALFIHRHSLVDLHAGRRPPGRRAGRPGQDQPCSCRSTWRSATRRATPTSCCLTRCTSSGSARRASIPTSEAPASSSWGSRLCGRTRPALGGDAYLDFMARSTRVAGRGRGRGAGGKDGAATNARRRCRTSTTTG